MKRMILKALFLVLSAIFMQHNAGLAQTIPEYCFVSNLKNNPLPKYPDTLRILGIGNSFTEDAMAYLPELLAGMEINNVTLGKMSIGGCSLEKHYNMYMQDTVAYSYNKSIAGENVWFGANR